MDTLMEDSLNAAALRPAADVKTARGVSMTEYRVTGDLANVLTAITMLFGEYHPAGYGTRVHSIEYVYEGGTYAARISRANSCE